MVSSGPQTWQAPDGPREMLLGRAGRHLRPQHPVLSTVVCTWCAEGARKAPKGVAGIADGPDHWPVHGLGHFPGSAKGMSSWP